MKTAQRVWNRETGWKDWSCGPALEKPQIIFVFGTRQCFAESPVLSDLQRDYPGSTIMGCSTAGHVFQESVLEDSVVVTAVQFDRTTVATFEAMVVNPEDSFSAGEHLASQLLAKQGLAHVFVLSDGLKVNGSKLVKGLTNKLPMQVAITGGLSGDDSRFQKTLVCLNDNGQSGRIVVLGLYGENIRVGYGSRGGWDPFGPERLVTRSKGNILYELDGESALTLYKRYLGSHATGLPASGLRFPLSMRENGSETSIVRTILAVNEQEQSMTFAGDVPEGVYARLMKTNVDRLIDGASEAAQASAQSLGTSSAELAILVSCVGRRLVLQQRTEEEVEAVRAAIGAQSAIAGFYSYGEVCPFTALGQCELHNQTMTITVFAEAA